MFNPAVFTQAEIVELERLCEAPPAAVHGCRLRAATDTEWRVLGGIAVGSIVCRRMPGFLESVMGAKEKLRFYATIQQQVEGELVLRLQSWSQVKDARQLTRDIKEDILTEAAALGNRVSFVELQQMLGLAKTLSYDCAERSIHFFFFDRATASKFELTQVPYSGAVYQLRNVHNPHSGSVWTRQLGRDGVRVTTQREYEIHISNITRFTDVGRLAAFLQKHLAVDFELDDMDDCTPNSRTSMQWKLKIKSAECSQYLRGIVRIFWFGRTLILKHPYARQRMQCFKCGNVGHVRAKCTLTPAQMHGEGSREASDAEIAGLEDLAKPFASMEEVRESTVARLKLQQDAEEKAQAAVRPAARQPEKAAADPMTSLPSAGATRAPESAHAAPPKTENRTPEAADHWVVVPKAHGRKSNGTPATFSPHGVQVSTRFDELADAEDGPEQEEQQDCRVADKPVIDVSLGDDTEEAPPQRISDSDKADLHLVRAKAPSLPATPQLVALKQRERQAIAVEALSFEKRRGRLRACAQQTDTSPTKFPQIEKELGLRPVTTPASGNCMAMAIAQAVADHSMAAFSKQLEDITAAVKRGIKWTAQLNYAEQFGHFQRVTSLINLERGWEGMTVQESNKQFKWYLEEYAGTPSDRDSYVPRHNWGSSELMAMAANLLQRSIYILAYDTDKKKLWYCSRFCPGTGTKGKKKIETGKQQPLRLHDCVEAIRKEKLAGKQLPLVLRYWGEHYSAYIHSGPWIANSNSQLPRESGTDTGSNTETLEDKPAGKETDSSSQAGASQDPWDPEEWHGDIDELRGRMHGMTIPHDLKCEIHLILHRADPSRYVELLTFLVSIVDRGTRETAIDGLAKGTHPGGDRVDAEVSNTPRSASQVAGMDRTGCGHGI
jgi:hypothetical protein